MYNKTCVGILIAHIFDDTYIEAEIDTLISNIDLSNYHIKTNWYIIFKYRFKQLLY